MGSREVVQVGEENLKQTTSATRTQQTSRRDRANAATEQRCAGLRVSGEVVHKGQVTRTWYKVEYGQEGGEEGEEAPPYKPRQTEQGVHAPAGQEVEHWMGRGGGRKNPGAWFRSHHPP